MFNIPQTSPTTRVHSVSRFISKVYAWMALSLVITAAVAYGVYSYPPIFQIIVRSQFSFLMLLGAQLALVFSLGRFINQLTFKTAAFMLATYAALLGVTLSVIFMVYQLPSIITIMGTSAAMFGFFALYGYFTKADLTSIGSLLFMGLWGIIIASFINMFLGNTVLGLLVSCIGVVIFAGLTAYDMQQIKHTALAVEHADLSTVNKRALIGALSLYLNFVNLFLRLLSLFGKRR
jgi:uncharacterized protein